MLNELPASSILIGVAETVIMSCRSESNSEAGFASAYKWLEAISRKKEKMEVVR